MTTAKRRYVVNWVRETRAFVVRNVEGDDIATDIQDITEAWLIHEALERADAERIAARQSAQSTAAKVRMLRHRSAYSLRA